MSYSAIIRRRLRDMIQKHSQDDTTPDLAELNHAGLFDVLRIAHLMHKTQTNAGTVGRYTAMIETVNVDLQYYVDESVFRLFLSATGIWAVTVKFTPEAITDWVFDNDNDFSLATV